MVCTDALLDIHADNWLDLATDYAGSVAFVGARRQDIDDHSDIECQVPDMKLSFELPTGECPVTIAAATQPSDCE